MAREEFHIGEEVKVIPAWAWVVAPLMFVGMQLLFNVFIPSQKNPPPFAFRLIMGLFMGMVLFFWWLLIGYVNRDSGRRGMNRALWTVIAIFVPNGIGFIIYFLMRQPLHMHCPQCGTTVEPGFNFCPKCHFNLTPTCSQCSRPVRHGDVYCAYCGHNLGGAPVTPAGLVNRG